MPGATACFLLHSFSGVGALPSAGAVSVLYASVQWKSDGRPAHSFKRRRRRPPALGAAAIMSALPQRHEIGQEERYEMSAVMKHHRSCRQGPACRRKGGKGWEGEKEERGGLR